MRVSFMSYAVWAEFAYVRKHGNKFVVICA